MKRNMVGKIFVASRKMYLMKIPIIPKVLWMVNRIIFACDIPYTAKVDYSVIFSHNALGVVVNRNACIGANTLILQNVTLGGNMGKKREYLNRTITSPVIGENVIVGTGAIILGPVVIGDNARIGAGAVVLNDVPEGKVALGVPAKVVS